MTPQLFPFSKNRYFPGKRLRSADFTRDQEFADHKLSFLSCWVFGSGVALGLDVQRLDADSLLVSPGFAVDALGRCLIVDEPAICCPRTLEGFDALDGETAVLCLSYREEKTDPMTVPGGESEIQEYAAARERFAFSLAGRDRLWGNAAERALFSDTVLFEDDELRVRQVIPKVLSGQGTTRLRLVMESFYPESVDIELRYAPLLPGFAPAAQGAALEIAKRLSLHRGETELSLEVRLTTAAQAVLISLPEDGFLLEKRGVQYRARGGFQEEFPIAPEDPLRSLRRRLLARSPQDLLEAPDGSGVPIALIRFVRYEENVLLDDVIPIPDRLRVEVPWLQAQLRRCGAFFPPPEEETPAEAPAARESAPAQDIQPVRPDPAATGVVTLRVGPDREEDGILYSDEIVHGLGPGAVWVEFGVENVYPVANSGRNHTDLLLGDASLFTQADGACHANFHRGVRIHPDKGTFELAVRLNGELRRAALRLRWFAWRTEEAGSAPAAAPGTLLRLEPDVIHTAPGAVVCFVPVFSSAVKAPCDFWVPDRRSGLITRDGIYTAPDREGLYQVCAQIREEPSSKVSAFVIVCAQPERTERGSEAV